MQSFIVYMKAYRILHIPVKPRHNIVSYTILHHTVLYIAEIAYNFIESTPGVENGDLNGMNIYSFLTSEWLLIFAKFSFNIKSLESWTFKFKGK